MKRTCNFWHVDWTLTGSIVSLTPVQCSLCYVPVVNTHFILLLHYTVKLLLMGYGILGNRLGSLVTV